MLCCIHLPQLPCCPPSATSGGPPSAFTALASPQAAPLCRCFCPLPTTPWLCRCPSPSAPAHRAGSSPGPSSPSGPLRSGETKAAVSRSGAGRPPQPYPGLLMYSPGPSVAQHPLPQHCSSLVHSFWCSAYFPPESTHLHTCGREGSLFRGGSEVGKHSNLPALPPRPPVTWPRPRHRPAAPGACRNPFPSSPDPASHLGFQSRSRMG